MIWFKMSKTMLEWQALISLIMFFIIIVNFWIKCTINLKPEISALIQRAQNLIETSCRKVANMFTYSAPPPK